MEVVKRDRKALENSAILIIAFAASIIARLAVISNNPSFLVGGDNPAYVAFSKEIISNGFLIPAHNSIHYPGSLWVVPPILPELFAIIISAAGTSGWAPFYALGVFGAVADSLIVFPLWKLTSLLFNRTSAVISVLAFIFFLPDMDVLAWGGYPQIVANFLILWIFYYTILLMKSEKGKVDHVLVIGILMSFLALIHDLSSLFLLAALAFYLIARNIARVSASLEQLFLVGDFSGKTRYIIASILFSAPAFAYWYLPRSQWVYDSIFHNPSLPVAINGAAYNLAAVSGSALPGQITQFILGIAAVPVFIAGMAAIIRSGRRSEGTFLLFSFISFSLIMTAVTIGNSTISGRLLYFAFMPAFIVVSYGIGESAGKIWRAANKRAGDGRRVISRKAITLIIVAVVLGVNVSIAVPAALGTHSYYLSGNGGSESNYLNSTVWIQQNIPVSEAIAAPGVFGSFIMGYAGNPVLVYRNPIYLTQPAEWNESIAAYSLIYQPSANITQTVHYISEYNVSIVCMYNSQAHNLPSFYKRIYSDNAVSIYRV